MNFSLRQKIFFVLLFACLFGTFLPNSIAQTNVEKFGKNRIQHRVFKWKYFDTKHFRIYHYDRSGRELARFVAEQVENDIAVIESKIGGKFSGRFNIVLYNSYDEYKQTNIGKKNDSQLQIVNAGTVNIVGDKLVVYHTGVHTDLRRQIRSGMARVIMERALFGDNIGEVVKNAILLNLPSWVVPGFISYIVDGWDPQTNSLWKNVIETYPEQGFFTMAEAHPELAGKAFWKYMSDNHGEGFMKNLMYTTLLKSSLNQATKSMLGIKAKYAYDSVLNFYTDIYQQDEKLQEQPDSVNALIEIDVPKDGTEIRSIRVSPNGKDVAYVAWKNGEYKVHIQRTESSQVRSTILAGGKLDYEAMPDPNYPMLTWSNTGYKLAILYKFKTETRLKIYNNLKARIENVTIPNNRFDRVLSMTFMEDDEKLIFSAIKKSQCDLYEFQIRGKRMTNITNDAWDDIQPWYVSGGSRRGILFISNRTRANVDAPIGVNELPTGPMNVYFYNMTTRRKELLQMTHVKKGNITQPIQYGSENYAYLYDDNGVQNQYLIMLENDKDNMDSAFSMPVTNYSRNVINHQYCPLSNQTAHVLRVGDKYKVYFNELKQLGKNASIKSLNPTLLKQTEQKKKHSVLTQQSAKDEVVQEEKEPILKKGNAFESDFENEGNNVKTTKAKATKVDNEPSLAFNDEIVSTEVDSTYINLRAYPYKGDFKPNQITVRLDNSILFNRYQPASFNGNQFQNPNLGGLITVSLDDVMEDYRFTGGIRPSLSFTGMTYFLQFENNRRYVDWSILYLRQTSLSNAEVLFIDTTSGVILPTEQLLKNTTDLVQGSAIYPINKFESIRMHLGVRRDALTYKVQDQLGLTALPEKNNLFWVLSRAEYVFDNTTNPALNIYRGFRYKFFGEYMYQMNGNSGGMYNFGTDFRYYKKIYKNFTWAARVAAAHSGGSKKILYFLGGVDNWMFAKTSNYTPVRTEDYAFQAIATNMRGYEQNSWNGNSYAMINTEFRLPVLATFLKKPIQSPILRNLQIVTFADVGSAWAGLWPTDQNASNPPSFVGSNGLTTIVTTIDQSKDVFGLGYGAGVRTSLFGYFVRLDAAWNVDNHRRSPLIHFSLGTDF